MDLAQAVDEVHLIKIEGEEGNAYKLAFQTDGSASEGRSYETTATKYGGKKTPGAYEGTHSLTTLLGRGDTTINKLKELVREDSPKRLLVWTLNRANISTKTTIPGEFSIDVVTSVDQSAGSDGNIEVSIETEVEGKIKSGEVNVTPELLAILQEISEEQEFLQPTTGQAVEPEEDPEV